MICKPVYEFLLWDNCNNNCSFCWQREQPRLYNQTTRSIILDEVIKFINSDKFVKGSHILVCGGEIFDKPKDCQILNNFFKKIVSLMLSNVIDLLYINTNLIYKDLTSLKFLLDLIKSNHLFDRLRFTTSYDIEGRFKKEEDKQLMLSNLKWINITYPECQIVTNIILTKQLCKSILSETFSVKFFMTVYNCWVNLIPYIVLNNDLTADRNLIFKTLLKVDNENEGYIKRYIKNLDLSQDKLLYMYKDNQFIFCSCDNDTCGHSINFKKYSDNNSCFICDLKKVFHEHLYY